MSRLELLHRASRLQARAAALRDEHDKLLRKIRKGDRAMLKKAGELWNEHLRCADRAAFFHAEAMKMETA
jgi:hypothetical protein